MTLQDQVRVEPEMVSDLPDHVLLRHANAIEVLKERTLTNLYDERLHWLDDAELERALAPTAGPKTSRSMRRWPASWHRTTSGRRPRI